MSNLYSFGLQLKIGSLLAFFDNNEINYTKIVNAYPNDNSALYNPKQYDMDKWLKAVKELFNYERSGISRREAIQKATYNWDQTEIYRFLNWVKYYQEGNQLKYKTAQKWYEGNSPGFLSQFKQHKEPEVTHIDSNAIIETPEDASRRADKKLVIERQRSKIIGRLDSAEKLLRSQEGQMFAADELEDLMESIYSLKKKIQLVNKMSSSMRLYGDMIVRDGNVLSRKGFNKAAEVLYAIADMPDLNAAPPPEPTQPEGAPGGLPTEMPGVPNVQTTSFNDQNKDQPPVAAFAPPPKELQETKSKGINEFLIQMETGGDTDKKTLDDNDVLEVEDDVLMVSEAQALAPPPATPAAPTTAPPATEEPLEVTEKDTPPNATEEEDKGNAIDIKLDEALKGITIEDVIAKLEDLSKVFKVREIPRQLAFIDIMLQNLGLSSYFTNLSEAQNKSLESNNYVSSRIEDILSKLRGAVASDNIDLTGETEEVNPAIQGIKNKLQQDDDKEKQRKEMRKKQENEEADDVLKETPNVDMGEDLATPAAVPAPTKVTAPIPPKV